MWPAVKLGFNQEEFRKYVAPITWNRWRPTRIMWHNTAAPSLAQWIKSAKDDQAKGLVGGTSRIASLERFFREDNHWTGCPHLFIANDLIWVMNPLTAAGVHSPSFNNSAIGIEMIGDYDTEDDDSGEGLRVENNTIFATAILCSALGIDPEPGVTDKHMRRIVSGTIFIHKQDWATTHDCPGKDVAEDHLAMVQSVRDLMAGGDHNPGDTAKVIAGEKPLEPTSVSVGTVLVNDLSFRTGPGVTNPSTGSLPRGTILYILDRAANGSSQWLKVKTPAGYIGWVAGRFVEV